jgi:sugar O-acyltransferase (sialic acid O-acetyltransferase NeuD family)
MKRLLLVGAGGHGRVVADLAELLGWDSIAFLDDGWPERTANRAWPIIGKVADLARLGAGYDATLVTIGVNAARLALHRKVRELSFAIPALVHPSAVVSRHATMGRAAVVLANVAVNAFAAVGEAVILNTACTVDHDCKVGDGVHISPGAHLAGTVTVGDRSWIGIGAAIRQGITIGSDVMIGAGSVVVADVADGVVAMGVPARPRN